MKPIIIAVIVTALIGWVAMNNLSIGEMFTTTTYEAPQEPVTVEKEVEVDYIAKAVEAAQREAQADIEAIAQAAYDQSYDHEMKKIELRVRQELQAQHEAHIEALEEELSF